MKIILFFSLALLIPGVAEAQRVSNGLYVNGESNEFVYICDDSIQFLLYNYDAMGTFSICKGLYEFKGKNRYYIQSEHVGEKTSVIDIEARKDALLQV